MDAAHQYKANAQALLGKSLGIPGECSLPAPPHYQNCKAVLDAFSAVIGEGENGSVLGHGSTGRNIASMVIVDADGRVGIVL